MPKPVVDDDREYIAGQPDAEADAYVDRTEDAPRRRESPSPVKAADPDGDDEDRVDEESGGEEGGEEETAEQVAAREETERRARSMGWVPPEEFRGDNGRKPLSADEFLARANPAVLHERMEKQEKDYNAKLERMERFHTKQREKETKDFEERIADLRRQRDENVIIEAEANGKESAEALRDRWDAHIKAEAGKGPPVDEIETPARSNDGPSPEVIQEINTAKGAWLQARPQFNTDPVFESAARMMMGRIAEEMKGQPFAAQFAELDRRLAATNRFADIYAPLPKPKPGVAAPPANRAMDGVRIAPKKTTNYSAKLNATERMMGEKFVARGTFKNLEDYAKDLHTNAD